MLEAATIISILSIYLLQGFRTEMNLLLAFLNIFKDLD